MRAEPTNRDVEIRPAAASFIASRKNELTVAAELPSKRGKEK
jgi:hypothetical protein